MTSPMPIDVDQILDRGLARIRQDPTLVRQLIDAAATAAVSTEEYLRGAAGLALIYGQPAVLVPVKVPPTVHPHVISHGLNVDSCHALADRLCQVCADPITTAPVSLVLAGRSRDDQGTWNAMAVAVHDACTGQP